MRKMELPKLFNTNIKNKREIYFYDCINCEKTRQTYFKHKAQAGICPICKRNQPPEGQQGLFEDENDEIGSVGRKIKTEVIYG